MLRLSIRAALLVGLVSAIAPDARAAYLTSFSGNTRMLSAVPGGVDGTVSFAVADRTGGTATDPWGLGIPLTTLQGAYVRGGFAGSTALSPATIDASAQFIYLFQTVNDGSNTFAISQSSTRLDPTAVTSWGDFAGFGLRDSAGLVSPTNPLGLAGPFVPALSPANVGGAEQPYQVVANAGTVAQSGAAGTPGVLIDVPALSFQRRWFNTGGLVAGATGALAFYTSNVGPILGAGSIQNGGTSANGFEPVNFIPEPTSLLLSGMGLSLLALPRWLRRRRAAQA